MENISIDKILAQPNARKAYFKLVKVKVKAQILEGWLREIGASSDKPRTSRYDKRGTKRLVKNSKG
jgi:hypothetical protein